MVFVVLGKVFPHKLDEQFTNTCFHISVILWGDPCNLSVSISSSVLSNAIIKRHWWKMSTILHCSFIDRFNFAKLFLITGWISNSLIDLLSELFDDCRWVVRKVAVSIRFYLGPFALFIAACTLSLYKPRPLLSITVLIRFNK